MQIYYDHLNCINVVSMRYILSVDEVEKAQKDFLEKVLSVTKKLRSQVFYTFEGVPTEEEATADSKIIVRFYISIEDDSVKDLPGAQFDSYFSLGDTVCCCRLLKDEISDVIPAQQKLLEFCEKKGWRPYTQIFYQLGLDDKNRYFMIKVGVCEPRIGTEEFKRFASGLHAGNK